MKMEVMKELKSCFNIESSREKSDRRENIENKVKIE